MELSFLLKNGNELLIQNGKEFKKKKKLRNFLIKNGKDLFNLNWEEIF